MGFGVDVFADRARMPCVVLLERASQGISSWGLPSIAVAHALLLPIVCVVHLAFWDVVARLHSRSGCGCFAAFGFKVRV